MKLARTAAFLIAGLGVLAVISTACGSDDEPTISDLRETAPEAAATSPPSEVAVTLSAGTASANLGTTAAVDIRAQISGEAGLGAWTMDIVFDPAIISVVTCAGSDEGESVCNPASGDGMGRIAGAALGLSGDVSLATYTFRCEAAGTSAIELVVELVADATVGDPRTIEPVVENGSITCG